MKVRLLTLDASKYVPPSLLRRGLGGGSAADTGTVRQPQQGLLAELAELADAPTELSLPDQNHLPRLRQAVKFNPVEIDPRRRASRVPDGGVLARGQNLVE